MPTTIKVLASIALVTAVLWWMWRLPKNDKYFRIAPPLALVSVWLSLAALAATIALWFVASPDTWVTATFFALDPASIAAGVLVLWIYRDLAGMEQTIDDQCMQAKVAITLGLIAVILGYIFVMTHKTLFTPIGS